MKPRLGLSKSKIIYITTPVNKIKLITGNQLTRLFFGNENPANKLQDKAKIINNQMIESGTVELSELNQLVIDSFTLIKAATI